MVPDPWAILARTDLTLVRAAIADDGRYYHAERAIVLRDDLLVVEERAVLFHELAHARRGDMTCGWPLDARMEASVDREAARWAIPLDALLDAVRGEPPLSDVADALKTTEHLLRVRLRSLHPAERGQLQRYLERRIHAA